MPDQQLSDELKPLERIVQGMMDRGEPEEKIAEIIKGFKSDLAMVKGDTYKGPTSFLEGAKQSITSGDALRTGLQGALGYLKGATLDLPSSIASTAMKGAKLVQNLADPASWDNPVETLKSIPQGLRDIGNVVQQAGSDPETFGRMMGQVTGQPLTTYGLAKAIPAMKAPVGAGLETTGRIMRQEQPVSGMIPRLAEPRTMRWVERNIGSGLESIGQSMRKPPAPSASASASSILEGPDKSTATVDAPRAPTGYRGLKKILGPESSEAVRDVGKDVVTEAMKKTTEGEPGPVTYPGYARFKGYWPEVGENQYDVVGGPLHGSTIGDATLRRLGIQVSQDTP